MVQVKREDRRKVYEYLLNEGVIVIKKDFQLEKHNDTGVQNLHVWMLLRSLKDKNLVELVFSWQYYYYYIKTEGVKYLRDKLGFVEEVVPFTFRKTDKNYEVEQAEGGRQQRPPRGPGDRGGFGRGGFGRGRGERRPQEQAAEPQAEAPAQ
ncbi:hypothetical protein pb186bvf_009504 [Paramecium bursaria]